MKFINKVIVFVMGLVVIGVLSTTINVVTQSRNVDKVVTFEILDSETYSPNVIDKVNLYSVIDVDVDVGGQVTNIQSLKVNDIEETQGLIVVLYPPEQDYVGQFGIYLQSKDGMDYFNGDGSYILEDGVFQVGDIITITFDVEQETPTIIKTLLFLAPLILSVSLIGFLAFKKGDE